LITECGYLLEDLPWSAWQLSIEVFILLEIWGEQQLKGSKRNKHVFDRMAEELCLYGIVKSRG